jgi:hypothetical protein
VTFKPGFGPGRGPRLRPFVQGTTWLRQPTQSGRARIQVSPSRTQTAKASIGTPTPVTQLGKARIKQLVAAIQAARARIQRTTSKTQPGRARIQKDATKTQTGRGRVTATTTRTQAGRGRVKVTTQRTQPGRAYIALPNRAILAPATPLLAAQYGTFKLDESMGIVITAAYDTEDTSVFGNYYIEFRLRLRPELFSGDDAADDATFASLMRAVESDVTGLRTPRQRLLVTLNGNTEVDWNFTQAAQTAFLIQPELKCITQNRRDATYGLRVRCQFPGNVPGNFFRRESVTHVGDSITSRRTCSITATWTSSPGKTSLENYADNGDTFFNAYLPANFVDQRGTTGSWIRADESPVSTNDERSLTSSTRTYWEVFAGRRDSSGKTLITIGDRRVFVAPSLWVATSTANALQNYLDGGNALYAHLLPSPSASGMEWVLVDEEPMFNDLDGFAVFDSSKHGGTLTVVRTYHEVLHGCRDVQMRVTTHPNQLRTVVISGTYYQTSDTAKNNYLNDVDRVVTAELLALTPAFDRYESKSVPRQEGHDVNNKRYFFTWTLNEIAYPQGPSDDDPDITISSLDLDRDIPYDAQSVSDAIPVTRLQVIRANFTAVVDYKNSQDPNSLWETKFRGFVLNAVATKLGANAVVDLLDEKVHIGLSSSTLSGFLVLLVTGGSVLSMRIEQTLIQIPSRDFASRADGTNFSAFPYRDVAEKVLMRIAAFEFVLGSDPGNPFAGSSVSGFGMIDTGKTGQQSVDEQNAPGAMSTTAGWHIDRRAPFPYSVKDVAVTRGNGFQTVIRLQVETWRYLAALEAGAILA